MLLHVVTVDMVSLIGVVVAVVVTVDMVSFDDLIVWVVWLIGDHQLLQITVTAATKLKSYSADCLPN